MPVALAQKPIQAPRPSVLVFLCGSIIRGSLSALRPLRNFGAFHRADLISLVGPDSTVRPGLSDLTGVNSPHAALAERRKAPAESPLALRGSRKDSWFVGRLRRSPKTFHGSQPASLRGKIGETKELAIS